MHEAGEGEQSECDNCCSGGDDLRHVTKIRAGARRSVALRSLLGRSSPDAAFSRDVKCSFVNPEQGFHGCERAANGGGFSVGMSDWGVA